MQPLTFTIRQHLKVGGWFHGFRKDRKVTSLVDISGFLSSTTRKETLEKTHPASNLERRSPPSSAILLYGVYSNDQLNTALQIFALLDSEKKIRFNNNKKEVDQVKNSVSVLFTHPFSHRSIYMALTNQLLFGVKAMVSVLFPKIRQIQSPA